MELYKIHAAEGFGGLSLVVDSTLRPYIEGRLNKLRNIPYPSQNDLLYGLVANLAATVSRTLREALAVERADLVLRDRSGTRFEAAPDGTGS